jgi:lysophospholipase L1-like esterase
VRRDRQAQTIRRAIAAACALALTAGVGHAATATSEPVPNSMAALGDSITRAFSACGEVADCPKDSWSTGASHAIDSHYRRILKVNPAIRGHAYNFAVSGARIADLQGQANAAVGDGVDYVTILIGANDACADTVADMTPVATFRADFAQAMDTISTGLPNARVFVASIPDIYRLWQLASPIHRARKIWNFFGICQSMLAHPLSMSAASMSRRQAVLQREIDYNTQLAQECALHAHCLFDDNAAFDHRFPLREIGTIDYFHPAAEGQATLAKVTYKAGFGW